MKFLYVNYHKSPLLVHQVQSTWLILLRKVLHLLSRYFSIHLPLVLIHRHLFRMRIYIRRFQCSRSVKNYFIKFLWSGFKNFHMKEKFVIKKFELFAIGANFRTFKKCLIYNFYNNFDIIFQWFSAIHIK